MLPDLGTTSHVYLEYPKEVYYRPDGTLRLRYMNDSDVLVVVDVNA